MDSQQLLDDLYRAKASLRKCLQGLATGTANRDEIEQWITEAIALNKAAIKELAEFEEPVTLDEIDTIFSGGTATDAADSAAAALNTHDGRLLYKLSYFAMMVLAIILAVFQYIALYDLYHSADPNNAVLYLILSIFFNITIYFFLFFNRKKDLGMPPRKQPEPVQIPQPVVEAPVVEEETPVVEETPAAEEVPVVGEEAPAAEETDEQPE